MSQGVQYTTVDDHALQSMHPSLNARHKLMLVNDFIAHTVDFMNKFAALSENKLANISNKTDQLEILLLLLEAKLESVSLDEVESQQQPSSAQENDPSIQNVPPPPGPPPVSSPPPPPQPLPPSESPPALEAPPLITDLVSSVPEPTEQPLGVNQCQIKDDPRYKRYYSMLTMGVPLPAVKIKFSAETGEDPRVLDNPPNTLVDPSTANALVPATEQPDDLSD